MSVDAGRAAALLRQLADVFAPANDVPVAEPPAQPAKRGRGRPVQGEAPPAASAAPAASTAGATPTSVASTEADPFETPTATTAPVPTATIEQVRKALTDLKNATTQENALALLKSAGGADTLPSLKPEKYGAVVAAAQQALKQPASVAADDPFGENTVVAEPVPTIEEIKALCVETQKRTSQDTVQRVVMSHGGKAANSDGSGDGPSLKALPVTAYLAVAKALKALPTTK